MAILTVAAAWDSAFERDAHESAGRAAGLTENELSAIRERRVPELDDPVELLCAQVARALTDGDVEDALWSTAASTLGEATIFELTTLVGYYATLALQLRVFRAG
jgi:4-carboxymuconolactone decarboxylase